MLAATAILAAAAVMAMIAFIPLSVRDAGKAITPPWEAPPRPGSTKHIDSAQALARYLRQLPEDGRQDRARELAWNAWWDGRPIGNLHRRSLRDLLVGNWFVFRPFTGPDERWHFLFFDGDGVMWACVSAPSQPTIFRLQRHRYELARDLVGAATIVVQRLGTSVDETWLRNARDGDFDFVHRPITYDSVTGILASHYTGTDGQWYRDSGHVQKTFSPAFSGLCPGIPRPSGVPPPFGPMDETPRTYREFMELESPEVVRHIQTLFPQDPDDPLTMGMYLSWYPPPDG